MIFNRIHEHVSKRLSWRQDMLAALHAVEDRLTKIETKETKIMSDVDNLNTAVANIAADQAALTDGVVKSNAELGVAIDVLKQAVANQNHDAIKAATDALVTAHSGNAQAIADLAAGTQRLTDAVNSVSASGGPAAPQG